jgi:hypothetical protein
MNIVLGVLLWAKPGRNDALVAYEDAVLKFVPEHLGVVRKRVRSDGGDDHPLEVQLLDFPSWAQFEEFMSETRRLSLKPNRDAAIEKTEVIEVRLVPAQD